MEANSRSYNFKQTLSVTIKEKWKNCLGLLTLISIKNLVLNITHQHLKI